MIGKQRPTRAPIAEEPLREPGESLREQFNDTLLDKVVVWWVVALAASIHAALDLYRWYFAVPPAPVIAAIIATVLLAVAVWRTIAWWPQLRNISRGLRGERQLGQFLQNELISKGYRVFHDLEDDRGNIDHVAIGPAGIFSIETKTVHKPMKGQSRVQFDGQRVLVNGRPPDRDPIVQARACAASLQNILREELGKSYEIQPVVIYPGWFVEEARVSDVWVLNEDRFIGWLKQERQHLSREEIEVIAAGLARYVRRF